MLGYEGSWYKKMEEKRIGWSCRGNKYKNKVSCSCWDNS